MTSPDRLATGDLFVDLSHRTKLRIGGADRVRFVNGQITNDVRKATDLCAIEACVLNAKGRMDAHVFVRADDACFYVDAAAELRSVLQPRLERYIIADDVTIEDATEQFALFHVLSATAPQLANSAPVVSSRRFADAGWDVWANSEDHEVMATELRRQLRFCDDACAEILRIEQGIARWGHELTNEIVPPEANLEERAIDYGKGCYIGQETISRMKMSGQRNKALSALVSTNDDALASGMRLRADNDKEVGSVTSAAFSSRLGRQIALGYVKRGFNACGTRLRAFDAADVAVDVEIVDLPFR